MFSALVVHGSYPHKIYKGFMHSNLIFDLGKKDNEWTERFKIH